jgi:hypothetical protein
MTRATVTTHFDVSDPGCEGDYIDVTIHVGRKLVAEFGDWYHDKGAEKANGFVQGLKYLYPKLVVRLTRKADRTVY